MSGLAAALLGAVLLGLGAGATLAPDARHRAGLWVMAAGVLLPALALGVASGSAELAALGGIALSLAGAWSVALRSQGEA